MTDSLDQSTFKLKVDKADVAVVDFWADWCYPCKAMSPVLEELEKKYEEKIKFFKVDIEKNHKIAENYGIESLPTIIVFRNGTPVSSIIGFKSKESLEKDIRNAIR
jgi:thioredoxin